LTPDDSATIIKGVAPSGTSKTMRRRKEAAAKKMDEVVRKLMHIAGGDSSLLEGDLALTVSPHIHGGEDTLKTLRSNGRD
jgi:hypothetical protein